MSERYRVRPSEIMNVEDEYTAYCLDEACVYISSKIKAGQERKKPEAAAGRTYSSFSAMYKDILK